MRKRIFKISIYTIRNSFRLKFDSMLEVSYEKSRARLRKSFSLNNALLFDDGSLKCNPNKIQMFANAFLHV